MSPERPNSYSCVGCTASTAESGQCDRDVGADRTQVARGARWSPLGKGYPYPAVCWEAVVLTHEEAADPAEGIGCRQLRSGRVGRPEQRHPTSAGKPHEREHSANQAAVLDQPGSAREHVQGVGRYSLPMEREVVRAR